MDNNNNVFDIPAYNYAALEERILKLNKRAAKLGCEPMRLTTLRDFTVEVKNFAGVKYQEPRREIRLEGETPKFNGWSLLAVIERQMNGENLVRCVPGQTVPKRYRKTDTRCDHCKSIRQRKEVFVLGHEDGKHIQVGRQCIADFLGHVSAESLAQQATWELSLADTCREAREEGFIRGDRFRSIHEFLATVAIVIRRLGWVSRKMIEERGDGQTTSSIAWSILCAPPSDDKMRAFVRENDLYVQDRDTELAEAALAWARKLTVNGQSDYLYNLGVACRQEVVDYRTVGIVASAVAAYQQHLEKEEELNIRRACNTSQHVGTLKERQDFENVRVNRLRYFESEWGVRTLVTFEDEAGNVLTWWASGEQDNVKEGDLVSIRGTVTKHSEYKGVPQTELKRVTITKGNLKR